MYYKCIPYLVLIGFLTSCGTENKEKTLFLSISSETSKIDFINKVVNTPELNVINFRNIYNGGGVAIGDINNDGLNDVYFTSNLEGNKLYLNQSDLAFRDISESSMTAGSSAWTNGVTMADINADGYLDIYVCHSEVNKLSNGKNELFINNKDNTFTESAELFGLDDDGFSTQAVFFDYDGDNDLDCFVLNNSIENPDAINLSKKKREEFDAKGGDRFYRNDNGNFVDVTASVGIYSSSLGFGLGVSIADFDNNNYPDIYVSNDFWERDYYYLNNGKGKFEEVLTEKVPSHSLNSMGGDAGDINNDGFVDIISTDMLPATSRRVKKMTQFDSPQAYNNKLLNGYHHQQLQNSLQLNLGNGSFQEIANLSGVASTDWSWGALVFDFDLDGWQDIFISNGIYQDLTDFDFVSFIEDKDEIAKLSSSKEDFNITDVISFLPSEPQANYAFVNDRKLGFINKSDSLGLGGKGFSNGAAYGDLDNDGDLDLIVNNLNSVATIYENLASASVNANFLKIRLLADDDNTFGIGAKVIAHYNGNSNTKEVVSTRGFQSSVAPEVVFGLGEESMIDSVTIIWPDGYRQSQKNIAGNQTLIISKLSELEKVNPSKNTTKKVTTYLDITINENSFAPYNSFPLDFHSFSGKGPKLLIGDLNGDKQDDFILLGSHGEENRCYLQQAGGRFIEKKQQSFFKDKHLEATCGALFDADSDGDLDLLVGHGGNEFVKEVAYFKPHFYENNGSGTFIFDEKRSPDAIGNLATIVTCDYDKDGDQDVFLGASNVPGYYGLVPASFLFENTGLGFWNNKTNKTIGTLGMVTGAVWSDYDQNGEEDLVIVGEFMPITILKNGSGQFVEKIEIPNSTGLWQCIAAVDLDGDNKDDYILGNWGENTKLKASIEKPLQLSVGQFENKRTALLEGFYQNDGFPSLYLGKNELQESFPTIKQRSLKYEQYASSTLTDLFGADAVNTASKYSAVTLSTSILWSGEKEGLKPLSKMFQVANTASITIMADKVVYLFGNEHDLPPYIGYMNSHYGIKADIKNSKSITAEPLGIKGQVRDSQIMNVSGKDALFVVRTNEPLISIEL